MKKDFFISGETNASNFNSSNSFFDMSSNAIPRNVVSNLLYFILSTVVGFWFVSFLLHRLGAGLFGLIALSMSIVRYLSLATPALNSAVGRNLTIDLSKKDYKSANVTFNTTLWGGFILVLFLLPFCAVFSWATPNLFRVPFGYENDARLIFFAMMVSFLITILSIGFNISTFVRNRFDLLNISRSIQLAARIFVPALLIALLGWGLNAVSLGIIFSALLCFFLGIIFWRRLTPELHINLKLKNKNGIINLVGISKWILVSQIGTLLFIQTDVIVINCFLGADATGLYGSLYLFVYAFRTLSGLIAGVLTPVMLNKFSHGDLVGVTDIASRSIRFLGIFLALPVGLICGLSKPLLTIWLGETFSKLAPVLFIMTIHLSLNLAITPIFGVNLTTNKIKLPAIASLMLGIANICIMIVLISPVFGLGLIGAAISSALTLTAKNSIFLPIYTSGVLGQKWWKLLGSLFPGFACSIIILSIALFVSLIGWIDGIIQFILFCGIVTIFYFVLAWKLLFPQRDRLWFNRQIRIHLIKMKEQLT